MRGGKALALACVLALALAACGGEPDRRVTAQGDAAPETAETTETTEAPTTTTALPPTTVAAPAVEAPKVTTTTINVPKVRLPVVSTTTTAKPKAVMSPLEPGAQRWGYGDLGVHRVITQGPTKLDFALYQLDTYDHELVEVFAEVHDQGVVRRVHADFGDGFQWEAHFHYSCDPQSAPYPKPNPIFYQSGRRAYAAPGAYKVTLTVTTVRCTEWGPDGQEIEPNTIVSSFTAYRHAGRRPT